MTVYDFKVKTNSAKEVGLDIYKGKPLLIVNVASKCGFTYQYKGLEELYKKFKDKGFTILGFPCNQFGSQEPGGASEIKSFCEVNFGVTFPLFYKIDVNGATADPLYQYLTKVKPGFLGIKRIKWNFTKFLIDREGRPVKRFGSFTKPEALERDIQKIL